MYYSCSDKNAGIEDTLNLTNISQQTVFPGKLPESRIPASFDAFVKMTDSQDKYIHNSTITKTGLLWKYF